MSKQKKGKVTECFQSSQIEKKRFSAKFFSSGEISDENLTLALTPEFNTPKLEQFMTSLL